MEREQLEKSLEGIRHLLSHLHGEVTALEESYSQVLQVLRKIEGTRAVDDLTGLDRRSAFFEKWNAILAECEKVGRNSGVLIIDIDHFKKINDTHGHPTGDEVIKRVAALLKQYESSACAVGRIGGEEFAVAAIGTDAELLGLAEFIRRGAEKLHGPIIGCDGKPSETVAWKCTLSVGVASTHAAGTETSKLMAAADQALYDAKKRGRNQVRSVA